MQQVYMRLQKKTTDRLFILDKIVQYLEALIKLIENKRKNNIIKLWRLYDTTLSRKVEIISDSKKIIGKAIDIDEYGFLLVETQNGIQRIITSDSVRFL